jgi:hypothetical protein
MKSEAIKNLAIAAAIVAAGVGVFLVVRKVSQTGASIGAAISDTVGDGIDYVKKAAGGAVDAVGGVVAETANVVTQEVPESLSNLGMNIFTGQGLQLKPGGYKTLAQRNTLTGGSMLLSDAEKAAIRRLDAGETGFLDTTVSKYQIFDEVGSLKRAENRESIYSLFN